MCRKLHDFIKQVSEGDYEYLPDKPYLESGSAHLDTAKK